MIFPIVNISSIQDANILDGTSFSCFSKVSNAGAATNYIQIVTPATGFIYLDQIQLRTDNGNVTADFNETVTYTNGVTPLTAFNLNRSSANTTTLTLASNPTVISGGTSLDTLMISASTTTFFPGANGISVFVPLRLKQNNKYLLAMSTFVANVLVAKITWREQTT